MSGEYPTHAARMVWSEAARAIGTHFANSPAVRLAEAIGGGELSFALVAAITLNTAVLHPEWAAGLTRLLMAGQPEEIRSAAEGMVRACPVEMHDE